MKNDSTVVAVSAMAMLLIVTGLQDANAQGPPTRTIPTFETARFDGVLLDGEKYIRLSNGCGMIDRGEGLTAKAVWTGTCQDGLIHGAGELLKTESLADDVGGPALLTDFYRGRWLQTRMYARTFTPGKPIHSLSRLFEDPKSRLSLAIAVVNDSLAVNWSEVTSLNSASVQITVAGVQETLLAFYNSSSKSYAIAMSSFTPGGEYVAPRNFPCPSAASHEGCDQVWNTVGIDILARARAVIKAADVRNTRLKQELDDVSTPEGARKYREEQAQIAAEEARALQVRREKAAAMDRELAEASAKAAREQAEEKERVALETKARQDEEEAVFQKSLASLNAGALYVLAVNSRDAGNIARAKAAVSALLTRFPDSNLAPNAASMLSSFK